MSEPNEAQLTQAEREVVTAALEWVRTPSKETEASLVLAVVKLALLAPETVEVRDA